MEEALVLLGKVLPVVLAQGMRAGREEAAQVLLALTLALRAHRQLVVMAGQEQLSHLREQLQLARIRLVLTLLAVVAVAGLEDLVELEALAAAATARQALIQQKEPMEPQIRAAVVVDAMHQRLREVLAVAA